MIPNSEVRAAALKYGVPDAQIWRDWVVSHLLHGLAESQTARIGDRTMVRSTRPSNGDGPDS